MPPVRAAGVALATAHTRSMLPGRAKCDVVAHVVGRYAEIVGCAIGKAINGNHNLGGASVGALSGRRPVGGFSVLGERRRQFVLGAIIILRSREHVRQKMVESTLQMRALWTRE